MKLEQIDTYNIPQHYAVAIVNGDCTGLDDWEEAALNFWLDSLPKGAELYPETDEDGDYLTDEFARDDITGLMVAVMLFGLYERRD